MYYTCKPSKIQIYINTKYKDSKKSPSEIISQIKTDLGCDIILNGGLYNMYTWQPVCHLRANNVQYATDPYKYMGYGWDLANINYMSSKDEDRVKNFICCVALVENGKPISQLIYNPDVGGVRGRTAIGRKSDGTFLIFCSKDGTSDAMTPEQLRAKMCELGCQDAIMLDGGNSSQCITPSGSISGGRIVQNYICIWTSTQSKPKRFIDVSKYQSAINWTKVKRNIDGAILRAGAGKTYIDETFEYNVKECNRLGIPVGAYWFSYALSVADAQEEAKKLLRAVKPYKMDLPLAFDYEYASHKGVAVTKDLVSGMSIAFCDIIKDAGYTPLNYTNIDYLTQYFTSTAAKRYGIWLAAWTNSATIESAPPRDCVIWQHGTGYLPGISVNVDMNYAYGEFKNPNGGVQPEEPKVECPYQEPTFSIRLGSMGTGAKWVQWYLNANGTNLTVDGVFGAASVKVLKEFQTKYKLTVDGICGSTTRALLKDHATAQEQTNTTPTTTTPSILVDGCPYTEPTKNLSYGAKGDNVKWLQWYLHECGYNITIDGGFGPSTRSALINFQSTNKLTADGICGKQTRDTLKSVAGHNDSGGHNSYIQTLIVKRNQMLDYIEKRVGDIYVYGSQGEPAGNTIINWSARCFPSYTTQIRADRMKQYVQTHPKNSCGEPIKAHDCSGLFWAAENLVELPLVDGKDIDDSTAAGLYQTYCVPISKFQLQPLDLVFNSGLTHVAVVGHNGKIYEAAGSDIGVVCNNSVDDRIVKSIYGPAYGCAERYQKEAWTKFGRLKIYAEAGI